MKIAVIGMGKIGLPLAVQYARKGHEVIGVDINTKTIDLINKGLEPFPEEEHLQEYLHEVISSKNLRATASYEEAVSDADVIVVVVPLFVNEKAEPDFTAMDSATRNVGKNLKKNSLVCYETTLPIGTTRKRFTPALEQESGLKVGKDFAVVFSPERVFTGRIFQDLRKYPKIVGGITEACAQRGVAFYEQVLDFDSRQDLTKPNGVWNVKSVESAEFVKLAETTYRDVNIGLANQFAIHADSIGMNIYEVIEAANSQYFSQIHQPGISVGGHCIPIYPHFYLSTDKTATIVKEARRVNKYMPHYAVEKIEEICTIAKTKILILGISYRSKVKETSFSGAIELYRELEQKDAEVYCLDSLFSKEEMDKLNIKTWNGNYENIQIIILHTHHSSFENLSWEKFINCDVVYDGRNFFDADYISKTLPKAKLIRLGNGLIKNKKI